MEDSLVSSITITKNKVDKRIGHKCVFKNKARKEELLQGRKNGLSIIALSKKFNVDHSTVIYHLQKAGLIIDKHERKKMIRDVKKTKNLTEVAKKYNIHENSVIFWSRNSQIDLSKCVYIPWKKKETNKTSSKNKRPGWMPDEKGGWICLGKNMSQINKEKAIKRKKEQEEYRNKLLDY